VKSVRTSTIRRSLIYQDNDKIFESGKEEARKWRAFETRSTPGLARSPRRPLPSISEIPFLVSCVPALNPFKSAQSADSRNPCRPRNPWSSTLLQLVSIRVDSWLASQSGAKSPHSVKERASHGAFTLQSASRAIREIRVIRGLLLLLLFVCIRVHSWLAPKILRNFP